MNRLTLMESVEKDNPNQLTSIEEKVLTIEESWWKLAPTKDRAITQELGISPMKYYIILSRMLEDKRVWKAKPVLVDRLQRLRDAKADERQLRR